MGRAAGSAIYGDLPLSRIVPPMCLEFTGLILLNEPLQFSDQHR
jgi:hypothetical protein